MAKTEFTKLRLLAITEILQLETDENHYLKTGEIIEKLQTRGIDAERKSIYRDMETLQDLGWDILSSKKGYCLASRTFELPELKLLSDAIGSSRSITEKKSYELLRKLETLTSRHNAQQLRRQVHLVGRPKAENEQIYYNVDALYDAIDKNSQISFRYLEWKPGGKREYRDKIYTASPYALCWDSENYYLVAHTEERGKTHFRVDKMAKIKLLGKQRLNQEEYRDLNMAQYSKQVFGMFGGEETVVKLWFPDNLADSAVDKFGSDIMMIPQKEGGFTITVPITVSPVFFSWVFSFAGRVRILSPDHVKEEYIALCKKIIEAEL